MVVLMKPSVMSDWFELFRFWGMYLGDCLADGKGLISRQRTSVRVNSPKRGGWRIRTQAMEG